MVCLFLASTLCPILAWRRRAIVPDGTVLGDVHFFHGVSAGFDDGKLSRAYGRGQFFVKIY